MIDAPFMPAALRPNLHWIHLAKLRPKWITETDRIYYFSPAAVMLIYDAVASADSEKEKYVPLFFKRATEQLASLKPPENSEELMFATTKVEAVGVQCAFELGFHFDQAGDCYVSASDDWIGRNKTDA